jgi:hypothetical protein
VSVVVTGILVASFVLVPAVFSFGLLRSSRRCCSSLSEQRFFSSARDSISQELFLFAVGLLCLFAMI